MTSTLRHAIFSMQPMLPHEPHQSTSCNLLQSKVTKQNNHTTIQKRFSMPNSTFDLIKKDVFKKEEKSSTNQILKTVNNTTSSPTLIKSFSENDLRIYSNPNLSNNDTRSLFHENNFHSSDSRKRISSIRADYVNLEAASKTRQSHLRGINKFCKKIIHQNSAIYETTTHKSFMSGSNTIVVVPSMDLDGDELKRISKGVELYEERQLYHLLLLADPSFRVIFLSTHPICQDVIRYYLTLDNCSNVVLNDRLSRLFLLSPGDFDLTASKLSDIVAKDSKLIATIRDIINRVSRGPESAAGLNVFCGSDAADNLASQLGLRLLEASGNTLYYGSKQGSREMFRITGVNCAPGTPDDNDDDLLTDIPDAKSNADRQRFIRTPRALSIGIARQIVFKNVKPKCWIVKLNQGFSGKGNAMLDLQDIQNKNYVDSFGCPLKGDILVDSMAHDINEKLPEMVFQCSSVAWNGNQYTGYKSQIERLGAIAEACIEGDNLTSPSVQAVIEPDTDNGEHCVHLLSTHEQVLNGQVYNGCINPASDKYRHVILQHTKLIGNELAKRGVVGHFATDFLTSCHRTENNETIVSVSAVEINLRQGGTTHPFATMALLTGGKTDDDGIFRTLDGGQRCYMATDAYSDDQLVGMTAKAFLQMLQDDINSEVKRLRWDGIKKVGVVFHILDFVELGKIGFTAIAETHKEARELFESATVFLKRVAFNHDQLH